MASLRSFMIRMNYLDRSSPFSSRKRRRRYSSATSTSSNLFTDPNNNVLLSPIVNPARSRRKVSACIYKPIPSSIDGPEDGTEQSPQLAVQIFEGLDVKLRNERNIPVSTERFLAFVQMDYTDSKAAVSTAYCVPQMVPVSTVYTSYPCYDSETKVETIVHCTRVEFRRRYLPVAKQTIDNDGSHKEEECDRQSFLCVSYASWNVSEYLED